jgi:GTP-binding protein LepA
MNPKNIRNFSIIAHIDHGKSTLADRLLELTGTVSSREVHEQMLDSMDLEKERGITIKAQTVSLNVSHEGEKYQLNLIDTPGHVDFSYEVSRSLNACEGALLIVDAAQGVQAQTLANVYMAMENDLEIIPILNKIDLPAADVDSVKDQIENFIGLDTTDILCISAKTGMGVKEVIDRVIKKIPPPTGDPKKPLRALIFDSWYDSYQGVISLIRIFEGEIAKRDKISFFKSVGKHDVLSLGHFSPEKTECNKLIAGDVGYLITGIRDLKEVKVGDTVTHTHSPAESPIDGFKESKPMVFSGIFPTEAVEYTNLRDALNKLTLNDSSFTYEHEKSEALGFGFRCGFLGLLHMEIVQERLEREYGLDLIVTAPTVIYKVITTKGEEIEIENPAKLPAVQKIDTISEPYIKLSIHTPSEYLGNILKICEDRRGSQIKMEYLSGNKVLLVYKMPLNEMVFDFYDKLKTVSKGYSSMDYEFVDYEVSDLVKLDVLVNGESVDSLALIVHRDKAESRGRDIAKKIKELLPKHQFIIPIQACIGGKIIARETLGALRKDVTAKCYGGDITRKRKLLEKQKEGKKRMKKIGNVEIPQKVFLAVLKV